MATKKKNITMGDDEFFIKVTHIGIKNKYDYPSTALIKLDKKEKSNQKQKIIANI